MTPARLPPPAGIPIPVPSPRPPPPVEVEVTEFEDMPTFIEQRCLGCAGEFEELPEDAQPPASYAQAWGPPYMGRCRGPARVPGKPPSWWWCRSPVEPIERPGDGRLTLPEQMEVSFFPDRRKLSVPVAVDQRTAVPR